MASTERYRVKTIRVSLACEGQVSDPISLPEDAARIARPIFEKLDPDVEHFAILALNARGRVNGYQIVSTGTLTGTLVHPREVFRSAILLAAASIILVHNHPSNDPSPSPEDIVLSQRMIMAGEILGIPVLDHLIVTVSNGFATA